MNEISQINTELSNHFYLHLSAIDSDITPEKSQALWQDIAGYYDERQRAYHTLQHIQQLFSQFEQVKHDLNEPHIIALALYYHDVIYEPTRSDNELKSARLAVEVLEPYLNIEQCQYIYALIMMTASHQINDEMGSNKNSDAAYLLDMDLSVLGMPWSEYEQYAKSVRQEYAHVADKNYQKGRTHVLNQLLAHPTLYLTTHYRSRLEAQARDNIKREIMLLLAS
ncbi:MAG: HD domain-containing protein [Psychrobacter sp.]|uniref:HD domain-containing protein n=1 Tax=Psychrobacter sp. AOP7-B1-24 TaxID=3457645 RepID=UPI003FB8C1B2